MFINTARFRETAHCQLDVLKKIELRVYDLKLNCKQRQHWFLFGHRFRAKKSAGPYRFKAKAQGLIRNIVKQLARPIDWLENRKLASKRNPIDIRLVSRLSASSKGNISKLFFNIRLHRHLLGLSYRKIQEGFYLQGLCR